MKSWKFIGEGLKPTGVNKNVLNILRTLIEDENSTVYLPQDYKRGSKSYGGDPRVHFNPSEAGKPMQIVSLTSHQERYNFSIVGLVDVKVEYPQNDGTVKLSPRKVFRTYNIIRDGQLEIESLVCKLSEDSFKALVESELLYYNGGIVPPNHRWDPDFIYRLDLTEIPLVSVNWAQPVHIGLYRYMLDDLLLSDELSVLRKIKKTMLSPVGSDDSENEVYNEAVSYGSSKSETKETYTADCLVYDLPEISVDGYEGKEELLSERYPTYKELSDRMSELSKRQKNVRFLVRSMIYAIEATKKQGSYDWSELALVPRSKEKYYQTTFIDIEGVKVKLRRMSYKKNVSI